MNEEWCKRFVDLDVGKVSISMDGATRETYNKFRIGSNYDKVIENIKTLVRVRKEANKKTPAIRLDMVLMKENVHELPLLVMLAKKLGVDGISTLHPQCLLEGLEKEHIVEMSAERCLSYYHLASNLAKTFKISLSLKHLSITKVGGCCSPWTSPSIDAYGDIYPCCVVASIKKKATEYFKDAPIRMDCSNMVMGNIRNDNFLDVWNSEKYNKFREDMISILNKQQSKKDWTMDDYLSLRRENKECSNYCEVCGLRFGMVC
jgi:MoaA/NifB/PqqE/SkfB family radical SAM enzyme